MPPSQPYAIVLCSYFPLPTRTGGQKRVVRFIEAIERAGLRPHLLISHALTAVQRDAGAELDARGWSYEVFDHPEPDMRSRLRYHAKREVAPHLPELVAAINDHAARGAAFVVLEEIQVAQYTPYVPAGTPAVVHLHNVDSEVYMDTARSLGTPVERARAMYHAWRMRNAERLAARRSDVLICVSAHDRDYFRKLGARNVLFIPNGVDENLLDLPGELPGTDNVLFFGSFGWRPNLVGLLRYVKGSWPEVVRRHPAARLRIAGSGDVEELQQAAAGVPNVDILGFVDDLHAELRQAQLSVAPLWIGGGTRIKVLEAMAAAKPVVGTSVGVEEIGFESGVHGLIADDEHGLTDATVRLLGDARFAQDCADRARELGRQFQYTEITAPLVDIYGRWARERAPVPADS